MSQSARLLCPLVKFQTAYLLRATSRPWKEVDIAYPEPAFEHQLPFTVKPRIERSPTAILEALSRTVGRDPTAPPYSLIDDPAMYPPPGKRHTLRHFYLAKDYGRRAARELAENWPTLFMFDRDKPRLPAFRPAKRVDLR